MTAALADSLASALSRLPGIAADVGEGAEYDYDIRGDLSVRDGRLILAVRLYRSRGTEPLWSSTYWRHAELSSELVTDLAQGVGEAVFGEVARRALATGRHQ